MLAAVRDGEGAIQMRMDIDAQSGIAAAAGPGPDLEEASVELHSVVVRDGALVLEAADACEVCGRGLPRRLWLGRGVGEVGIEARAEAVKDVLSLGEGPRLGEAEFDDEAILKGAKEPLHAALALGGGGGDPADAEFLERAPDLGRGDVALELLG